MLVEVADRFARLGPDLVFERERTEDLCVSNEEEHGGTAGGPFGHPWLKLQRNAAIAVAKEGGPTHRVPRAVHGGLDTSTRHRSKVRGRELAAVVSGRGDDRAREGML